jgi:hypothetical protein
LNEFKVNQLVLNEAVTMRLIKNHLLQALRDSEKKLLDLMEAEVLRTTYKEAPGKPRWRQDLRKSLRKLEEVITDDYMCATVGADIDQDTYHFVRAMIITYGSGDKVGNKPIQAGPEGREVWTDDLDGKKSSKAKATYLLPDEFNQTGNQFISNAVKLMQKHFYDTLDEASCSLPDSVFYNNVKVIQGG